MTQSDVGKHLGITRQAYTQYENGKRNPDPETLVKLADLFDVSMDYLAGRTDDPTPEHKVTAPDWATSRDKRDLKKFLGNTEIMFDGVPLTDEDRAMVQRVLEGIFWDAKKMNKRKRSDKD